MRNGLEFFVKTNSKRRWNLAQYHSPHSLTWSWILSLGLFAGDEKRFWPLFMKHRDNNGLQWWLRIPFIGMLEWHCQQPLWYRDLYNNMYERQMQAEGLLLLPDNHPNKVHRKRKAALTVVTDGGASWH